MGWSRAGSMHCTHLVELVVRLRLRRERLALGRSSRLRRARALPDARRLRQRPPRNLREPHRVGRAQQRAAAAAQPAAAQPAAAALRQLRLELVDLGVARREHLLHGLHLLLHVRVALARGVERVGRV